MNKIVLSALILACLTAAGLAAQTPEQDPTEADIEVVVTASRVEEPVEETPAYVSVITAEDLSASGQTTLVDALEGLAGIHFRSTSGNSAQAEISMRGFGENSHGRVLVLLDGRRLNRPDMASINWLEIPLENIERVEVVRGGSSVLYGDNAVAGVINIITKRGSQDLSFDTSAKYGSFNQNQESIGVSGSLGDLRLSATVEHSATDGYRERSAYRSVGGGLSLGLDRERFAGSLALSYNGLSYQLPGALTAAEFEADPTQAQPFHTADEATNHYLNAALDMAVGPGDSWLLDAELSYGLKAIRTDMVSWLSFSDLVLHRVSLTPRLDLNVDFLAGNRLIAGIDGYLDMLGLTTYADIDRTSATLEGRLTKATLGLYASDELSLLPSLSLNAGLRYELGRIAVSAPFEDAQLLRSFVYDAGMRLNAGRASRLWARFGRVFRYPFTDEMVDLYGFLAEPFNTNLQPEQGHQVDAGAETRLLGVLKLAAGGFWLEMQDEIAYDSGSNLNVNLDGTRRLGVESEIGLAIPSRLELSGSYTYTHAVFREGPYEGNTIPLVPAHQAAVEAELLLPLGFSVGGSAQYVGEQHFGGDPDNAQGLLPDYFLVGAGVSWRPSYLPGKLQLHLGVENILDARHASTGFYDPWTPGVYYYPGEGRSWKVGGSYRY